MCVAVGELLDQFDYSAPFIENYNGKRWSVSWTDESGYFLAQTGSVGALTNVSCASASFCIAVGYSDTGQDPRLLVVWNGRDWRTVPLPSLPSNFPTYQIGSMKGLGCEFIALCGENGVSCPTVTFCAAIGTLQANVDPEEYSGPVPTENTIEFWDGHTWTNQIGPTFPQPSSGCCGIGAVSCTTTHVCTELGTAPSANGGSQLEVYHGTGINWVAPTIPALAGTVPLALACPSQHACIGIVGRPINSALLESTLYLRF
jgi:hypothetical protein